MILLGIQKHAEPQRFQLMSQFGGVFHTIRMSVGYEIIIAK